MPLVAVAPGLWSVTHTMRFPGGVRLPTRMSVARLGGDGLLVHSAVPIDDALAVEIARLGNVLYIVAPNCFHHLHVGPLLSERPAVRRTRPGPEADRSRVRRDPKRHFRPPDIR